MTIDFIPTKTIRAPRGTILTCKGWLQEAALRMLMNNLDPDVAEDPDHLIVYGGRGQAARSWEAYEAIIRTLQTLDNDETLLVQSGKPVGVVKTTPDSPRVMIANSNLVPHWATQEHFDELAAKGLIMYGQMTAGSWIYIGSQGILQGTYETLSAAAQQYFGGTLRGTLTVTAGLGGMGGAQPLAVTMNDGVCLIAEVNEQRIQRRLETRYLDVAFNDLDTAIQRALQAKADQEALSIGVLCNARDLYEGLLGSNVIPEIVTDQTPAHDVKMYVPADMSYAKVLELRERDPNTYHRLSLDTMTRSVQAMVELQNRGAVVFDYGNNIRQRAYDNGYKDAFAFQGFVPKFIRPLFCEGKGPFRWAALSGDPQDIYRTDQAILDLFPEDQALARWIHKAQERIAWQGLPARICWLGQGARAKAGLAFNELVARGEVSAPLVIGRDHLDTGSVASPNRETEGMKDGTDAVSDWALLNLMVNTASGASWVSFHHGGGVGIGFSQHAGQVIVADGTPEAAKRLERVLTNDPAMGVFRHADAGYEIALDTAQKNHLRIPMLE